MDVKVEIKTDQLLDIMDTYKTGGNVKTFVTDIEKDYYIFECILKELINAGYDITDFITLVYDGRIKIYDEQDLKEMDARTISIYNAAGVNVAYDHSI